MKIVCQKEDIEPIVSKAEKITGKNTTLPALRGILIVAKKNITLKSTNLDLGLEIVIPGKVEEEGSVLIDGGLLTSFLSNTPNNTRLEIKKDDKKVSISGKGIKTNITTLPQEDFPLIPKTKKEKVFLLDPKGFVGGLKSVWFSATNSNIKPELSGVYIYKEGESLVFVATDSFRLSEKKVVAPGLREFEPLLLPTKNIPEIIRVLEDQGGQTEVVAEESQISFFSNNLYLTSRVIGVDFPDYKQIIPKETKTEAVVLKEDLLTSLKLANIFADKFNQIVFNINPGKKTLSIKSKNQEKGENTGALDAALKGEPVEIGFNYRYVMDVFGSIASDSLSLSLSGAGKPMLIKGVSDNSFLYVVMPMNK